MKVTGRIEMIKTSGRTDKFVRKQLPEDYFLAIKITDIDGTPISTVASAYAALKPSFPSIQVGEEEVSNLFEPYQLASGMTDVCHLSLAYFGDFRIERNTDNDLDQGKVDAAFEELHGQVVSFEIQDPFQVVSTKKEFEQINTKANLVFAPAVGMGRDTILNLFPSQATQKHFAKILEPVFGEGFQLWNAQKKPVPFHVTIAQTDKLNTKIATFVAGLETQSEKSDAAAAAVLP